MIPARPAKAANAKGVDTFFIGGPAERLQDLESKDEWLVEAVQRAVGQARGGVMLPWGAARPGDLGRPTPVCIMRPANRKQYGYRENGLQHASVLRAGSTFSSAARR